MNDSGVDLATLAATVILEDEEERVDLKLTPVGRRFELEVGSFYLELCPFPPGEYSCFHFDDCDTFEVINKTDYSNLAINDCIRFSFVEKAEGMKFLMRLSTAGILQPLFAEDDNVYEAINYAELVEMNKPKLRSNVQHVLEKVLKPFLPRRSPKDSERTPEDLEEGIYNSIDEQQLHLGSDGALTRSPSNSSGQPTPPAHIYEGNNLLTRNMVNNVNYSRPKRRPPAPPKDLSVSVNYYTKEDVNLDDDSKNQTNKIKDFASQNKFSENYRNDERRRVALSIKDVEREIASKLPVDPATRSPSPEEEKSNMSVRDKINRFKMSETANKNFQLSPLSSRRPRKTPIPSNPVTMQTMTRSSNSVLPAKTIESKVEIMEDTSLSDKEVLSSVDQLSVKGLAHRFSTTLVSSSQPDCLAPTTTFNGNKDFQQTGVDTKKLLQPIVRKKESSPPSMPRKFEPKKVKGRVTNAMFLPFHENGTSMTLKERIEKLQSQSQPKL